SMATFFASNSASSTASASVLRLLYWQVTHQAAVKSTNTGRPSAASSPARGRPGLPALAVRGGHGGRRAAHHVPADRARQPRGDRDQQAGQHDAGAAAQREG